MLHNIFRLCFDLFLEKVESGVEDQEYYEIPNLEKESVPSSKYINLENMLTIFKSQHAQVPIPPAKEETAEQSEAHEQVN